MTRTQFVRLALTMLILGFVVPLAVLVGGVLGGYFASRITGY